MSPSFSFSNSESSVHSDASPAVAGMASPREAAAIECADFAAEGERERHPAPAPAGA